MSAPWPAAAIARCIDDGVTERPPLPGIKYVGCVVHPRRPGPLTLAIAHRDGDMHILDLLRDGLTVAQSAELLHAYNIDEVIGMLDDDDGLASAHATLGAINKLSDPS